MKTNATAPNDKGFRFPPKIISHADWWYFRFSLSFRDGEEFLVQRGIIVTYETVRQWCLTFGQTYANELRRRRPRCGDKWHLDEVVLTICGQKHYLWRAVDQDGNVLDILVQSRRNTKAAKRFFRKRLKGLQYVPRVIITDKLRYQSYPLSPYLSLSATRKIVLALKNKEVIMMRRFERTTSGSERDARGLDSDIQRLSMRETREAQRHRQETTSPTEHYDRAISPTRKLRDLLHEDGTLKLEDAKRYFRQKAHHTRAALEALKRRSRSLERHALEQHNMDGAHPRDQIAFLEKTERKLSRDSDFWEGAQRVADKIDTLNNTCIEQANYMEKMTPSSYQRGVQEAKNGLRQIGIKDHVIDRVGKDIEDVSKAIQTRITELQYSHDPADWEKIEQAKVIKKSVDHDFRKMKEDDYYDKTQNGQLQRLERYYYETHVQMEQLDHEVTNTKTLTKDIARQNLVKDIADHVKPGASEHIASLFKELVPRHEAERAAYQSLGKKDTGVDARFFNPEHWDYKLKWQRDDPQYRDFFPMREGPVCNPAAMTRIFSRYHPEIASSDRRLHKKFEEIHNAHPEGEAGKKVGWTAQERADHLNDALERGGLDIPPPRGKVVRFEVRRGFNYNDLKACMNVRDGRGDYIPVTVGVSAYDKNTRDYNDHVIVLQKERDRRDDQGNHYIEFHAYDPYRVIKPHSGKMGLVDIQVLSHSQKRHGGIYEPGGMGANAAVVPVLHDAPGQE